MCPTMKQMKNKTILYLAKGSESTLLKRRVLADYFGEAELEILPSGKPIIKKPEGYSISVSHSGGIIGIVIGEGSLGLDIQERGERKERLYSFFHESERDCDFDSLWVKKEAVGKLTGEGVFLQKGKKLEEGYFFLDISNEVTAFALKAFSAVIASKSEIRNLEIRFENI